VNKPLIRFARRLTSWESGTADNDLIQTEFWDRNRAQPDLRPSVYEIDPGEVVQAFAEHATAFEPPSSAGGIDVGGTAHFVEATPGETGFSFTTNAHREVILEDRDDLLSLVRHVRGSLGRRVHQVSRAEVHEYVRTRLSTEDVEWQRARTNPGAARWLTKLKS
jgi:hypothetical protein